MSSRRGRGRGRGGANRSSENGEGDVRGPTSALTSFLREQGITAPQNDRFRARQRREQEQAQVNGPATASTSRQSQDVILEEEGEAQGDALDEEPISPVAGPSSPSKRKKVAKPTEDSDLSDLDGDVVIVSGSTSKKVATESQPKKKLSTAAMKKKQAAKKALDDKDAGPKAPVPPPKLRYGDRTPGAFVYCSECGTKFTFTKYTPYSADGKGVLCPPCQQENKVPNNAGGGEAGDSPASKKRARAVKPKPVPLEKPKVQVKTLQNSCIHMIGKNIDNIEELGDIGPMNLDKVCMIVCKNRGLTVETIKLFLDMATSKLALYDCARLDASAYELIANFAPKLRSLTLNYCGALKSDVLQYMQERMTNLVRLELYGAFLVKPEIWKGYFDSFLAGSRDPLEGFLLRQSPRFDASCVLRLAENFPNLQELRLAEIQQLDDDALKYLYGLKNLRLLDLSHAGIQGQNLTDDGIVPLLEKVGQNLETLVLNENEYLTDRTLLEGIRTNCPKIRHLGLRLLYEVLPSGVIGLFGDWKENPGLETLDISRCTEIDDKALQCIIEHSASTLVELDMNSVDRDITEQGIRALFGCEALRKLDIGFVRSLDDFLMKELLDKCGKLERLSVFGCNRVTVIFKLLNMEDHLYTKLSQTGWQDHAPTMQGVQIQGSSGFKVEY